MGGGGGGEDKNFLCRKQTRLFGGQGHSLERVACETTAKATVENFARGEKVLNRGSSHVGDSVDFRKKYILSFFSFFVVVL